MITIQKPEFLINAIEDYARSVGLLTYRMVSMLGIKDSTYDLLSRGNVVHTAENLDALMRFSVILGLREANPKALIEATDAEMDAWIRAHTADIIQLRNDMDARWRTQIGKMHKHYSMIRRYAFNICFGAVIVVLMLLGVRSLFERIDQMVYGLIVFVGMIAGVSGGVGLLAWFNISAQNFRYGGMKVF